MKLRDKDTKKYLLSVAVSTFVSYVVTFISFYGRVYYDIIETTCVCICLLNVVTALLGSLLNQIARCLYWYCIGSWILLPCCP